MDKRTVNFESLISYFVKVYQNTLDNDEKIFAQKYVKTYVEKLRARDLKNDSIYEEMLKQVGLTLKDLDGYKAVITEEKKEDKSDENDLTEEEIELNEYIEENIGTVPKVRDEFNKLMSKLREDMQNPNEVLIKTWVNNYKEFVHRNNLDEEMMRKFLEFLFVTYCEELNGKEWLDFAKEVYSVENEKEKEIVNTEEVPSLDDFDEETIKKETPVEKPTEEPAKEETPVEKPTEEPAKEETPIEKTTEEPSKEETPVEKSTEKFEKKEPIPADAIEIVSLKKPVNQKLLTNVKNGAIAYAVLGLFGTLPAFVGAIAVPAMINLWRGTRYEKKLEEILKDNNLIVQGKDGKLILYDKEKGCPISKSEIAEDRYEQIKKDMIKIGASDYNLLKRFNKFNIISGMMGFAKNSLRRSKEYLLKRGERLAKIKQADSDKNPEMYEKYSNSKIRYDEESGTYLITDSEGNVIIEETESKGRSK